MEQKRKPGRPPKNPVDPNMVKSRKYPRNPDPDMNEIIRLVVDALNYANAPIDAGDFLGAQYSNRFGYCKHALESIAAELGVLK